MQRLDSNIESKSSNNTYLNSQGTVVLGKNVRLLLRSFGRGARSNPAANSKLAIALRSKRKVELETKQTKQMHARERPHRRAGGRSEKRTRSEALKARKRDSIQRMWIEERERI